QIVRSAARISADGTVLDLKTREGAALSARSTDADAVKGLQVERIRFVYDAVGYVKSEHYETSYGKPKPNAAGVYGYAYERSPNGLPVGLWRLNIRGEHTSTPDGVFESRYEHDAWGFVTRWCDFTAEGHPAGGSTGVSCRTMTRDDVGNERQVSYFAVD